MKEDFKKYSHRLTDEEREAIWRGIPQAKNHETRRRIQFWSTFGVSAAAVTALLLVALFIDWGPDKMSGFDELAMAPEKTERAVEELEAIDMAAGPEAPEETPTVATSDHALRAPAASKGRGTQAETESPRVANDHEARVTVRSRDTGRLGSEEAVLPGRRETATQAADEGAATPGIIGSRAGLGAKSEPARDSDEAAAPVAKPSGELSVAMLAEAESLVEERARRETAPQFIGRIYGRVVDAETGDPLPYANVVLKGTNYGAMTLEDGSFSFTAPCGRYTIIVSYLGYEESRKGGMWICGGAPASLDFALQPSIALEMDKVVVGGEVPAVDVRDSSPGKKSEDLRTFAVENVQESMSLEAGITMKSGNVHVRGGRSGEVSWMIEGVPDRSEREDDAWRPRERRRRCWWTPPDYHHPNGEPFDAMYFQHYGVNPFIVTEEDEYSTFAIDVDNASYTLTRRYLDEGHLPPEDAVRVEEFVNYFEQGYEAPREGDFAIYVDGAPSPYGDGYHLMRVGLKGREVSERRRKPANLVFVIDTSGSMARESRLGLVKRALHLLLDELRDSDTVGIVEYGSVGRIVLRPTALEDRRTIERAIDRLQPNGSTNAEEGLELGYEMASRIYERGSINRLILCSDGVANTGETRAERILDKVRYESDRGIHLSAVGFGMGNYNDVLMEKLADQGDGNYYYVDDIDEAQRVFVENLTGTLQTIARDTKVQVEFDPEQVLRWRLLGYENRDVADEDFRNDDVDAGEVGAGHEVTALYEIKLSADAARSLERRGGRRGKGLSLATVRLRYELPASESRRAGDVLEIEEEATLRDLARDFGDADPHLQRDVLAAEFAEILRGSYWARGNRIADLESAAGLLDRRMRRDEATRELRELVERAADLSERQR